MSTARTHCPCACAPPPTGAHVRTWWAARPSSRVSCRYKNLNIKLVQQYGINEQTAQHLSRSCVPAPRHTTRSIPQRRRTQLRFLVHEYAAKLVWGSGRMPRTLVCVVSVPVVLLQLDSRPRWLHRHVKNLAPPTAAPALLMPLAPSDARVVLWRVGMDGRVEGGFTGLAWVAHG